MDADREKMLAHIRRWLATEKHRLRNRFVSDGDVAYLLSGETALIDTLIAALFGLYHRDSEAPVALVAVGGYGRKELFPYSDIDLLFLHDGRNGRTAEHIAKNILYVLWDLGLAVGQAHRTIDEAIALAKDDITIRTSLLDARLVAGDAKILERFQSRFRQEIISKTIPQFIEAKLAERDERHHHFGDSRYVLEPNVKEGKGGLRDLHTLAWLARYSTPIHDLKDLIKKNILTREEYAAFENAQQFLSKVRAHLHILAERGEERLTFDRQHAVAVAMGYAHANPNRAVERFMRRYFAAVRVAGNVTRVFCALFEAMHRPEPRKLLTWPWTPGKFKREGKRLTIKSAQSFSRQPILMLELFHLSRIQNLDIHPEALQGIARNLFRIDHKLRNDPRAGEIFLDLLLTENGAETSLRKMSEAGVLGRFIPEFGRVVGQTQFNMYHVYTVDEHTLVAIGILHAIENGEFKKTLPLASLLFHRIRMRRVLYLSLFCHDIAKGRGGDHSTLGEKIVTKLARRFGFSEEEADTAAWLVRQHLLFSNTAFKRDIDDPKTIEDFVAEVKSPERLKLLLLLTVADMRAVSATVWNAWKAALLEELYHAAEQMMAQGEVVRERQQTKELRHGLIAALPGWEESAIDAYIEQAPAGFLTGLPAARHAAIARMLKESAPLLLDTAHDYERAMTEITVATPDRPGLFSKLAGAMSLSGVNIIGAKIFTLKNGMAIDVFQVQDTAGDVFDRTDRLARMSAAIEQALSDELNLPKALSGQRKHYGRTSRDAHAAAGQVFIDNNASNIHTVIEITGHDRPGFLYQVTHAIAVLGLSIASAHISTYGTQIADVFYVKDAFGMKILHDAKIKEIRDTILAAVNSPASV